MPALAYDQAAQLLDVLFAEAERAFHEKKRVGVTTSIEAAGKTLFASATQSYREVLVGCCLARLLDTTINVCHPYVNQGDDAFNGRTLDERVVNPFLQERMIPCSRGPYLASFRRNVKFAPDTGKGLRDKAGYAALLTLLEALSRADAAQARNLTVFVLYGLCELRDASRIELFQISRLSLDQYDRLVEALLQVKSGGLMPVLLTVAMLRAIKHCFGLPWEVEFQGINVSDKASGVGGDITIRQEGDIVLAIEVTERTVDKSRVVSTFNTKVVRAGIQDYLFVYSMAAPTAEARDAARTYFSQGHEINFVQVGAWITNNLATIGARCRANFTRELLALLGDRETPVTVKIAWNDAVRKLVQV